MNLAQFILRQVAARVSHDTARLGAAFAYSNTGGFTFNMIPFRANRTTGSSSRKNRKPGDFDPTIPERD